MGLGTITKYKLGQEIYGITILRVFPENVVFNYKRNTYKYFGTQYYVRHNKRVYFLEDYHIDKFVDNQKKECERILNIARSLKIKLMLDKKYEG